MGYRLVKKRAEGKILPQYFSPGGWLDVVLIEEGGRILVVFWQLLEAEIENFSSGKLWRCQVHFLSGGRPRPLNLAATETPRGIDQETPDEIEWQIAIRRVDYSMTPSAHLWRN